MNDWRSRRREQFRRIVLGPTVAREVAASVSDATPRSLLDDSRTPPKPRRITLSYAELAAFRAQKLRVDTLRWHPSRAPA